MINEAHDDSEEFELVAGVNDETASPATDDPALICPEGIPEKFWDGETGQVRTDALVKSYVELEKRLTKSLPMPSEDDPESIHRVLTALGRPDTPDDYEIDAEGMGIEPDPEVNRTLHAAGLTQDQVELVYRLAGERLRPALEEMETDFAVARDRMKLEQHFGGAQRWNQVACQLKEWGEARFSPDAFESISSTVDGVLALHEMMRSQEPEMVGQAGNEREALSETQLHSMVADPRYWRDRDPDFIARVAAGFSKLFPD